MNSKKILCLALLLGTTSCKNILTSLEKSQVTGLLSASFRSLSAVNDANQYTYLIRGYCGKNGSTIQIEPSIGSATCSGGQFSFTADLSGQPEGNLNLSLNAVSGPLTETNADALVVLKDTMVPSGSNINFNANDSLSSYDIDGDCNEEGSTITVQYLTLSQNTTCVGGVYAFSLNLSSYFTQTAISASDVETTDHPYEHTTEVIHDPDDYFTANFTPSYVNPNFQFTFSDAAQNSSQQTWPISLNTKIGVNSTYQVKFGLAASTTCSVTGDYDPTIYNLGTQATLSKFGFVVDDLLKVCAWLTDAMGNNIFREETWTIKPYPLVNNFACLNGAPGSLTSGTLACYGLWDSGNAYGNDQNICGPLGSPATGCTVTATQCASGTATATSFFSPGSFSVTDPVTLDLATRTMSYPDLVLRAIVQIWNYTCD